jgi:thiamine-phosphate pyrophosphorylase
MMKKYCITASPSYFQLRKYMPHFALYRDKESQNYALKAEEFVQMCKQIPSLKAFLHQDYKLAASLGAAGVHLTSKQFDKIEKAKNAGLEVIISTHTYEEVQKAQELGADYVTYSPIFATPNKGEPKGVEDLKNLLEKTDMKVFALGGIINEEQVKEIAKTKAYGFASIRYFQ